MSVEPISIRIFVLAEVTLVNFLGIEDLGNPEVTGEDVLLLQEAVGDTHVTDLVGYRGSLEDYFTSATLGTFLVYVGSELISVMHMTVMFI